MGKVPEHATRVFKGQIFDVYQWEQELYDGSVATFERLKRPNTVQVIPVVGDKILISHEEQPMKPLFHCLLGGRQDGNEDSLTTAKRELLEECGYTSDDWELIGEYEPVTKIEWTVYVYVARNCKKVSEPKLDPGEKITVKELHFDEFMSTLERDDFHGREIKSELLHIKHDSEKLEKFKLKLFPQK